MPSSSDAIFDLLIFSPSWRTVARPFGKTTPAAPRHAASHQCSFFALAKTWSVRPMPRVRRSLPSLLRTVVSWKLRHFHIGYEGINVRMRLCRNADSGVSDRLFSNLEKGGISVELRLNGVSDATREQQAFGEQHGELGTISASSWRWRGRGPSVGGYHLGVNHTTVARRLSGLEKRLRTTAGDPHHPMGQC